MALRVFGALVCTALGLAAAAAPCSSVHAASRDTAMPTLPDEVAIARLANDAMVRANVQGLAIAVIDDGTVHPFGRRNASGAPLTPDTIMYAASLTKALFGYYAMMLVDDGLLDLDRPIAALLPQPLPAYGNVAAYGNWGDLDGDDRWQRITPRMALNHSTGFANFSFLEPDRRLRFHFEPGTRYAYSGEGMMLLQFGLERGLGLSVGEDIDRRIFRPLGMTRSGLMWRADFADNNADGWTAGGDVEPHDDRSRVRMAGSLDASIADMARLAAAMVSGWGLSRAAHAEFARPHLPLTTRSQFPTLQPEAPAAERPAASAATGVIAFDGPQGPGWFKGGHNDSTANTLLCLTRSRRCVLIMANDVRIEPQFPAMVRQILGETGAPWRWEYPDAAP